jgi:hypothetical protein
VSETKEQDAKSGRFNIHVISSRVYDLRAETPELCRKWVTALSSAASERWAMLSNAKSLAEKYMEEEKQKEAKAKEATRSRMAAEKKKKAVVFR